MSVYYYPGQIQEPTFDDEEPRRVRYLKKFLREEEVSELELVLADRKLIYEMQPACECSDAGIYCYIYAAEETDNLRYEEEMARWHFKRAEFELGLVKWRQNRAEYEANKAVENERGERETFIRLCKKYKGETP